MLPRAAQISNRARLPNLLTQSSKSPQWRLVRKGIAPAFSLQNMRRAPAAGPAPAPAPAMTRHVRLGCLCCFTAMGRRRARSLRTGYGSVAEVVGELVGALRTADSAAVLDMDDLCQRESLEVIGRIGFGIRFGALR